MAKEIDKIIQSKTAPKSNNVLWDDGENLKIFRNGKWESTGLTSDQQEMVNKLLDAYGDLPEDLDSIKEIANTPADFLNNDYELGGMVNMPISYTNSFPNTFEYDGTKGTFDAGYIENFYYGNIVIAARVYGSGVREYRIQEMKGVDNKVPIYGPVYAYVNENNHLIITSTSDYRPCVIEFTAFSGKRTLPLSFTTPYIVGNDTQEHLDELYRRLDEGNSSFQSIICITRNSMSNINGLGLFTPTYNENWIIKVTSADNIVYEIGGDNGQPLKDLITLNNVDDSLIIETSDLVPTPDWNANEGEAGYIKNKTHALTKELAVEKQYIGIGHTIEGNNIFRLSPFHSYHSLCFKFFEEHINADTTAAVEYILKPYDYILQYSNMGEYNYEYGKIIFNDDDYTVTITLEAPPFIKIYLEIYYVTGLKQIDPVFISNTVLKTTPQTLSGDAKNQVKENLGITNSDWNAQEGESGYIKNKYFGPTKHEETKVIWNNNIATITERPNTQNYLVYPVKSSTEEIYYSVIKLHKDLNYINLDVGSGANAGRIDVYYSNGIYTLESPNHKDLFDYDWYVSFYDPVAIPEPFIPNTIARTANYELPHVTFWQDKTAENKIVAETYAYKKVICDLHVGGNKPNINTVVLQNAEYYNGVITGIKEGKFVQYAVNSSTGEITLKHEIDIVELYNKVEAITITVDE